ncbi:hypothetical protein AB1484_34465 [Parafrankia sp. FMc6]|uniref:hypothetical protein n=1 Tax=Parafrankia soli TaxID=2599596 RepID=UPI0034D74903
MSLAGYSPGSFGLAGEGVAITATEVDARASRSAVTRARKIRYISPALAQLFETMLQLDRGLGWSTVEPARPTLEFDAEADPDPSKVAATIELLRRATVISIRTSVEMAHPDWDDERIDSEVLTIQDEQGASVPDPLTLGSVPITPAPAVPALDPAVAQPAAVVQ